MYRIFYPERDATIYEKYPSKNTGIDQILELTKIASGSRWNGQIQSNTYNSRILINFGTEITTLRTAVNAGVIPPLGNTSNSASVYLTLKAAEASDLLLDYTLEAYPISQSWINGNGNYNDIPEIKNGVSWYYRSSEDIADYWDTGSASSVGSGSATETNGGGTWIVGSGYVASQSFSNESPDIRMNVTDIVNKWVTNDIQNYGFIIKRSLADELSGDNLGSLKFFGRESHTIFVPRLEVAWNNTIFASTGSAEISSTTYVPYIKNIKPEYHRNEIVKLRMGVRPEFPTRTYQTGSYYLQNLRLPTSSYYSIEDTVTEEVIIPFDTMGTQIDCDSEGSFFAMRMDSFFPERIYKIAVKIERDGGNDTQIFDDFYFKVID